MSGPGCGWVMPAAAAAGGKAGAGQCDRDLGLSSSLQSLQHSISSTDSQQAWLQAGPDNGPALYARTLRQCSSEGIEAEDMIMAGNHIE